ncbi:MAG: haloacid dehalogenase type II [Rhodocyclaceae bacterium]|nr:haloacid dehalogenase type II [Rhodocyclaceae bacterium]MCB1890689.1 haloacid dehalogenase type II [Rhodocyclaceae bacterium]MCW5594368.1 haloacid dehalogenase type II [Rhodocyclaceae bacterium]
MTHPIRAIAFDAYGTLFDVYSVGALAEQLFPGKGAELAAQWRDTQIGYTRVRTLSDRYIPFWELTQDALIFSARKLGLDLTDDARKRLMSQYACLSAFPENLGALKELKKMGVQLAILSNGTPDMLDIAVKSAGMSGLFDHLLSVESVKKYKTAPEAYQLGPDAFKLPTREILFVSSNCWDALGATWFGYTTFWINRSGQPLEELGVTPTAQGRLLTDVVDLVKKSLKESS